MKTFVHVPVVLMLLHCRWLLRRGAGFKFHAYCIVDWFLSSKAPPWLVFTSSSRTAWTMTPSRLMDFISPWEISSSPSCKERNFGRQMSIYRSSTPLLRKVCAFSCLQPERSTYSVVNWSSVRLSVCMSVVCLFIIPSCLHIECNI